MLAAAGTLVGPRRAAIGFRRYRDHEQPARRHRFELTLQEPGLGAGLPCVWHPCGRLLAIARDHAVFEVDTGSADELVIGEGLAVQKPHALRRGLDAHSPRPADPHAPGLKSAIAVAEAAEVDPPCETTVSVEAPPT